MPATLCNAGTVRRARHSSPPREMLERAAACRAEIREALSGNFCRCTGYQAIVDAIEAVAGAAQRWQP